MSNNGSIAPEWSVDQWLNTQGPYSLASMRGKVVMLHAFQMLCPGCVSHALPQAQRAWDMFSHDDLMVVGLHTVFEHHDAMTPTALKAFIHEYRLSFPIAIDTPGNNDYQPITMRDYTMRGTPSLVLIDRDGIIRRHGFGRIDDLMLGAELATLIATRKSSGESTEDDKQVASGCTDEVCALD